MQNVITYDAVIGVSNADLKLFPGMTANVKILVTTRSNALRVPNGALRYHPALEPSASRGITGTGKETVPQKAVWILDGKGAPQRVEVSTGETDGTFTEVTGGALKEGDRVIVAALAVAAPTPGSSPGAAGGRGGPRF